MTATEQLHDALEDVYAAANEFCDVYAVDETSDADVAIALLGLKEAMDAMHALFTETTA